MILVIWYRSWLRCDKRHAIIMREKKSKNGTIPIPEILAPAGTRPSYLAAVAAKADAIYCGLKSFSARMGSINFTFQELEPLVHLAHEKGIKTYITLNSLLGIGDLPQALNTLSELKVRVKPDGIIIQDLAWIELARQAAFSGEIHLSTLMNCSYTQALSTCRNMIGADRVVIPRELNIDEIKSFASEAPENLGLEVFIHGALCYGVSGRCYWSSFLGGKSGLKGRCVQPCRRNYDRPDRTRISFSCRDLCLDALVKVLRPIPQIRAWKIEGRKKGPHYVYYTARAYRLLRDQGNDATMKKTALGLLERALGRNTTHYNFLPQRPFAPFEQGDGTASGLLIGHVKGKGKNIYLSPRAELLPNDKLRIGYETQPWHATLTIRRRVPRNGRYQLSRGSRKSPVNGTPVFLIDRCEPALEKMIKDLGSKLGSVNPKPAEHRKRKLIWPRKHTVSHRPSSVVLFRRVQQRRKSPEMTALWLSTEALAQAGKRQAARAWWWLPPVIWPEMEGEVKTSISKILAFGGSRFVLNMPWQVEYFQNSKGLDLWAGPFCNIANPLAAKIALSMGFSGIIVSPELGKKDFLELPRKSPLPLAIVESGLWPLCISRTLLQDIKSEQPFISPKGEASWAVRYGSTYWIYPNWQIDIRSKRRELERAGYRIFIRMAEPVPPTIRIKKRPGLWNWEIGLK